MVASASRSWCRRPKLWALICRDYKPDSPAAADALAVADAAFRLLGLADGKGASDGAA